MGRRKTVGDDEILRRARHVFREGGHAAATRDVARAAGISQAVLYQRFGSKENLFVRAMTPDPPALESLLGPYPPRNVRADLTDIGERLAEYLAALMPTLLHVLAHPDLGHHRLRKWHQGLPFEPLVAALADRFARLRDDRLLGRIDPTAAARAFLAAVHSAAALETMTHHGDPEGRRAHVESLVGILWAGLAPTRATARKPAKTDGARRRSR